MALISFFLSFIIILHFLLPILYSLNPYPPPDFTTTQGLLVAEKTRLGSTPPNCHNKCNECHPCTAVQVPTLPGQGRLEPGAPPAAAAASRTQVKPFDYFDSSTSLGEGNRYSNYKPLGWKCRCDGHFYNS